jgi:hypothetical protein
VERASIACGRTHVGWAALVTVATLGLPGVGRAAWTVEAMLGNAVNLPTTLTLDVDSAPMTDHRAEWQTRGFELPLYYAARIARVDSTRAWAIDFIHHKVHLTNTTPSVEHYEVSHGCNLVFLTRMFLFDGWYAATGIGAVIAHPENTVAGVPLGDDGYTLTGPAVEAVGGYRLPIGEQWFCTAELRVTGAHVRVPVANGFSSFENVALHALVGVGWRVAR